MSKKIYLIGGVDSFGVPYTRDNKNNINHLNEVFNYLIKQGIEATMIDMYSMHKYNDTDYINILLDHDISLYEIKQNQIESIDLCRKSGIFQFVQLPDKTKKLYDLNYADKDKKLINVLKNNDVVFVYSCGINDFLKYMNTDLTKLLLPKNMEKAFKDIERTINIIIGKIDSNIKKLVEINKEIEIYVLGIYIPTRVKYIRNLVKCPINLYNIELQKLCAKYGNVHFIDNSNLGKNNMAHVDWHPNYTGQKLMGENIISELKQKSKILKRN